MRHILIAVILLVGCAPTRKITIRLVPEDQPQRTDWHREPVIEQLASKNIVLYNHADPSLRGEKILDLLQAQYDFLRDYVGAGPEWVFVHVGSKYPNGFAMGDAPFPEMFLQAGRIFDTQHDYAHEMMHCFSYSFGALPHWFNESISDVAYVDAEIELYGRRKEEPFLETFNRIDHRSYELLSLRRLHGRTYFRRVFAILRRSAEEGSKALSPDASLEDRNLYLISVLSEAAGEDLLPRFTDEYGFNPRTRERQRGY